MTNQRTLIVGIMFGAVGAVALIVYLSRGGKPGAPGGSPTTEPILHAADGKKEPPPQAELHERYKGRQLDGTWPGYGGNEAWAARLITVPGRIVYSNGTQKNYIELRWEFVNAKDDKVYLCSSYPRLDTADVLSLAAFLQHIKETPKAVGADVNESILYWSAPSRLFSTNYNVKTNTWSWPNNISLPMDAFIAHLRESVKDLENFNTIKPALALPK